MGSFYISGILKMVSRKCQNVGILEKLKVMITWNYCSVEIFLLIGHTQCLRLLALFLFPLNSSLKRRTVHRLFLRPSWLQSVQILNLNDIESNFLITDRKGQTRVSVLQRMLDYIIEVEVD